jgi:triosephosphate isomerase
MHGGKDENERRLDALLRHAPERANGVRIGVCVPFPYLAQAEQALRRSEIAWGAQDISAQNSGAYTGEVSAVMAAEFGARYVIVGHSERRSHHFESSPTIARKAQRALEQGITPVVCVGETLEERESGRTNQIVSLQVAEILDQLSDDLWFKLVFAYEPVWAIGTGRTASPAQAQEVHKHIRELLSSRSEECSRVPILYGGSVKAMNAVELFCEADIDGALVGGASLDSIEFAAICAAAAHRATHVAAS